MKYCDFNSVLVDKQNGFRRDRSCNDHIFVYPVLSRTIFQRKKSTFCAFVDMVKAFDKINKIDRNLIFYSLLNYNIEGKIYKVIKSFYNETWSGIRLCNCIYIDFFLTITGVGQGDNLSATLFALYINDLARELKELAIGDKINKLVIPILLFTDNIV